MILDETYDLIKTKCKGRLNDLIISNVCVGVFLTAVKLSDGSAGVASTNISSSANGYQQKRNLGNFSPSKINGVRVVDLFENDPDSEIIGTLKAAALNALSSQMISKSNYKILNGVDPLDLIDLSLLRRITIVGAFQSYIKKISATKNKLHVLEFHENALNDDHKQFYVPAEKYNEILPDSDIVIITGLTLINKTIDNLLKFVPTNATVIVTGPTSSLIPDALFRRNVKILGAARITNPELLFTVVSEAGTGFHLFKYCAEKICIVNE